MSKHYYYGRPPSTLISAPVVKLEAGLAKYSAVETISSGSPNRRSTASVFASLSAAQCLAISVLNEPGRKPFTRTFGANSIACAVVSAFSAAFAPA